ncbi:sterile alpha motif domain-containing protein 15-like isoform X2 [Girardinichthys multiradiatus]|uniref:sterile alpha motif domain-containing protein 15-like isoform X2 n=1 Tax=Girardinichthys multiradiatus TaxID=208333 RepID=UPI001FAD34FE|nr:sterile alpha motif domain-containing protein 15-like isoform X2 [Girardinichthys multiradiatus]
MEFLQWDSRDVARWIESLGFPQYKVICARVRELLGITETLWSRSIADPRQDPVALFLEKKSRTGEHAEALTFQRFLYDFYQ